MLCPPDYFGVEYEINAWMHRSVPVDSELVQAQWQGLVRNLESAGATVETMPPVRGLPDMVFTANAGLVDGDRFLVSRFRYPERQPEAACDRAWFRQKGFRLLDLSGDPAPYFEGAGDALPFTGQLVAGYGPRSEKTAYNLVSDLLGIRVVPVRLVDPRFYHVDLTFCPLDDRHAIVNPYGWDADGCAAIKKLVPEPLVLEEDEAATFCANSVVVGSTILMPACSPRVGRILESWGFDVCVTPVTEFLKAGGGVRCLTLALDVRLSCGATGD